MTAGRIIIDDGNRALDSNANPIPGGRVRAYTAGTSTPVTIYTTAALSVAHSGIADASGFLGQMWADTTALLDVKTFLAADSGYTTPQKTYLNVTPQGAVSSQASGSTPASLADIADTRGRYGEAIVSTLYGGSIWIFKEQVKVQSTIISVADELHQIGTGPDGAGMWECQVGSIMGWLRQQHAVYYAHNIAKLRLSSSITPATRINFLGDSIIHGQVAEGYAGSENLSGTATGYGDGSTHVWDRIGTTIPEYVETYLESVYSTGDVDMNNRGYSGDTIANGYVRTKYAPAAEFSFWAYGTNDVLTASDNGGGDGSSQLGVIQAINTRTIEFIVDEFVKVYYKCLAREIIRGTCPILVAPYPFESLVGFDATVYASAKLSTYFINAIYDIGRAFDAPVVDLGDSVGQHDIDTVLIDGVHPNDVACQIAGAACAAPLCGRGYRWPFTVDGGTTVMTVNVTREPLEGKGATELTNIPNDNSFARPFSTATAAADLFVTAGTAVTYSFYLNCDETDVMALGTMTNGGSGTKTCDIIVDFEAGPTSTTKRQPYPKTDLREFAVIGTREDRPNLKKTLSVSTSGAKEFGHPVVLADHLRVQGRGWHTVTISSPSSGGGTFTLSGLLFGNFGGWKALTLATGFTQHDDILPAWRVHQGMFEMRGTVVNDTPSASDRPIFTFPTDLSAATMTATWASAMTLIDHLGVQIKWTGTALNWIDSDTSGSVADKLNLAAVKLPILALPGG